MFFTQPCTFDRSQYSAEYYFKFYMYYIISVKFDITEVSSWHILCNVIHRSLFDVNNNIDNV